MALKHLTFVSLLLAFLNLGMLSFGFPTTPTPPPEQNNTDPFTIMALNESYPEIHGKYIWTYSGITYLDNGPANPRYSFPVVAKLSDNKLQRIPQSNDPAQTQTIGNLNFGTSGVCCSYAQLKFDTPESLPATSRVSPFYIDTAGMLVWENAPYRQPWYLCQKGEQKWLWLGLPYYAYEGKPELYCTAVKLAIVRPL